MSSTNKQLIHSESNFSSYSYVLRLKMVFFRNVLVIRLYLGVFYFTILFKTFEANNSLTEINAINIQNLIYKINFNDIDIRHENNSRRSLVHGYNDFKCKEQFAELSSSFNKSELWALKGESNHFW